MFAQMSCMTTASHWTLITSTVVSRGLLLEEWYGWKARVGLAGLVLSKYSSRRQGRKQVVLSSIQESMVKTF